MSIFVRHNSAANSQKRLNEQAFLGSRKAPPDAQRVVRTDSASLVVSKGSESLVPAPQIFASLVTRASTCFAWMAVLHCDGVWPVCLRCPVRHHDEFPRARHRHEALRNSVGFVAAIGRARAQMPLHGNPLATQWPPSQATAGNAFEAKQTVFVCVPGNYCPLSWLIWGSGWKKVRDAQRFAEEPKGARASEGNKRSSAKTPSNMPSAEGNPNCARRTHTPAAVPKSATTKTAHKKRSPGAAPVSRRKQPCGNGSRLASGVGRQTGAESGLRGRAVSQG
ncbi:hypothetical protein ERJ75_001200600 [Trypanosoma vivax]|nr:hypothetical protein ERJ75_001200600 [Trypanosoma vivax]